MTAGELQFMKQTPEILQRKIVAKSRLFTIEEIHLRFTNGEERHFERFKGRGDGAVLIVPFLTHDTILLIKEYAAGTERYELGFPKGMLDSNEDIFTGANREMMEEIGYGAKELQIIKHTTASPGYWKSEATIMVATDLYPSKLMGDEPEPLEVIPWKIQNYKELLDREDFTEARSIAALLLVKEKML
jgi:ADP-ribose diphosphatase